MRRAVAALLAVASLGACTPPDEDATELRDAFARSERAARTVSVTSVDPTSAYVIEGRVEDDLRYAYSLAAHGTELVGYVVHDDALAVRLMDPSIAGRIANELGTPAVDAALRDGSWVLDPSGAPPPLVDQDAPDPFRRTHDLLRTVNAAVSTARLTKEFSLEDVEYRPALDPWRYPEDDEVRYDLLRPALPRSAGYLVGGGGVGIGEAEFRKTSVYVSSGSVAEICEVVDVEGHEDFVELDERGTDSNPFLRDLRESIRTDALAENVDARQLHLTVGYADALEVALPEQHVSGDLEVFGAAFAQAVAGGLLRPERVAVVDACLRG